MISPQAEEALTLLMQTLTQQPELEEVIHERWRSLSATSTSLPVDVAVATDTLGAALLALSRSGEPVSSLAKAFAEPTAPVLLLWCYASTWRRDVQLAPLLLLAARHSELRERVAAVVTVTDAEIVDAMRFAFERLKLVLEPSGASALAALLQGRADVAGARAGVVLSGGNVDVDRFRSLTAS